MSATAERVRDVVAPLITSFEQDGPSLELYDVEFNGGVLRVVLDRPGGVDMGVITDVTRTVSAALDEADVISSAYTLEVSSPGLERSLRTPEHFVGAIGEQVRIKRRPGADGARRISGRLTSADVGSPDPTVSVELDDGSVESIRLDDIGRARIHVDWTPPPKPGKGTGKHEPASPAADADRTERARDATSPATTQSEAT